MNVLFIKPPWASLTTGSANFPIGLAYLASSIRDIVDTVSIVNGDYWHGRVHRDEYVFLEGTPHPCALEKAFSLIERALVHLRPDIACVSLMTPEFDMAQKTITLIRRIVPHAIIVVGGIHVSLLPRETLEELDVDFAICGEGEKALRALVAALKKGPVSSSIPGVWQKKEGHVVAPDEPALLCTPEEIPLPALDVLFNPDNEPVNYGMIYTGRGCPAQCTFCATRRLWPLPVRTSSVERIMKEVKRLYDSYHVREIRFVDDTFTAHRPTVMALCRELMTFPQLKWSADTQACCVDKELLLAMAEAGCVQVNIGVETGSLRMYKAIRKSGTLPQTIDLIHCADALGLAVVAYFIIGFPGETRSDVDDTLRLMKTLPAYPIVSIATPYPGTVMYEHAQERIPLSVLHKYSELYHHTEMPLNMTDMSDAEWNHIKQIFHDEVKSLSLKYDMARHHRDCMARYQKKHTESL